MAWFADLQPCTQFPGVWENLLAVGWLAKGRPYRRGRLDRELIQSLGGYWSWEPAGASRGRHVCELCSEEDGPRNGTGTIFIPGEGALYVAPRLITHYMRKHGYAPPPEFVRAVKNAPDRNSEMYQIAVSAHLGGNVEGRRTPIKALEGLEAVRLRPALYVGPTDARALGVMLRKVVDDRLHEYLEGHATRLSIDIDARGWVTVEDDGNGISMERETDGLSRFERLFTTLRPAPTPVASAAHVRIKHGPDPGAAAVNALSARFEVETRLAGTAYRATFGSGVPVRSANAGATPSLGTVIRYRPDDELFDDGARHDLGTIEADLVELARLCPGFDILFQGRSLQRVDGLAGWLPELAPELVEETLLTAAGTANRVQVDVAFAWRPRASAPLIRSFVNYSPAAELGSHVAGLLDAVDELVGQKLASSKQQVLSGLVAVVHVGLLHPPFTGRGRLDSDDARVAVRRLVKREINAAPGWLRRLHRAIESDPSAQKLQGR